MKPQKEIKMDTFKTRSQKAFDAEIERLLKELETITDRDDYAKAVDNIKMLCAAREMKDPGGVSMETLLTVAANLIGVLVVLNFEKTGVITSKAFGWIGRK
jgi:hypothetical protein